MGQLDRLRYSFLLPEQPRQRRVDFGVVHALLPHALATLAHTAPDLHIEVTQRETRPALEELRSRAVDLVLGIDYEPAPVARHRDVHRVDLIRERVLLAVPAQDPLAASGDPISLAAVEHAVWAAGQHGTGHGAAVESLTFQLRFQTTNDDNAFNVGGKMVSIPLVQNGSGPVNSRNSAALNVHER